MPIADQTRTSSEEAAAPAAALPRGIEFYKLQIAGHHYSKKFNYVGMLIDSRTGTILKPIQPAPRGDCEIAFYEKVWSKDEESRASCEQLRSLIPRYFGTVDLQIDGKGRRFMQLENVTFLFKKPCVVDVKIGLRTWDPDADHEKIAYELSKYPFIRSLGFRFLGMKVFNPLTRSLVAFDKKWAKKLTEADVDKTLRIFFNHDADLPSSSVIVTGIVQKLKAIEAWFTSQKQFVFYSSSLLIAYDAEAPCPTYDVKMIDFTHVFSSCGDLDSNYLSGLRNLMNCLTNYTKLERVPT